MMFIDTKIALIYLFCNFTAEIFNKLFKIKKNIRYENRYFNSRR